MKLTVKTNVAAYVKKLSAETQIVQDTIGPSRSKATRENNRVNSVADDFLPELDAKVRKLVEDAVERAKANSRKTVMGRDL